MRVIEKPKEEYPWVIIDKTEEIGRYLSKRDAENAALLLTTEVKS
jgi:hypothetical protein